MKIAYLEDLEELTNILAIKIMALFVAEDKLDSAVSVHGTSPAAHTDIRDLISTLSTRLNTLADSDDTTLDQLSEIVAYIKNNKDLIEGITTSKVNVSDIIDGLTSTAANNPLSAKQGKVLKELIDSLDVRVTTSYATKNSVEDLKKSVSDGKTLVAGAITDKGVETAADATFATMAENIGQIETGGEVNLLETLEFTSFVNPLSAGNDFAATWIANDTEYAGVKNVVFKGLIPQDKSVTPTTSAQTIRADEGKVLNTVTVRGANIAAGYSGEIRMACLIVNPSFVEVPTNGCSTLKVENTAATGGTLRTIVIEANGTIIATVSNQKADEKIQSIDVSGYDKVKITTTKGTTSGNGYTVTGNYTFE